MMPRLRIVLLLAVTLACAFVPTPTAVVAVTAGEPTSSDDAPTAKPSDDDRTMRSELRDLAGAWADGGGEFGYPFWEKAGRRWHAKEITATMYREYVTGYRDRLVLGCDLLDATDTSSDVTDEVRTHVLDACNDRVDALRAQQRWLDELIDIAAAPDEDSADAQERAAKHEADAIEALQRSYRDTRLAMDQAQAELDRAGLERLPEDAFL